MMPVFLIIPEIKIVVNYYLPHIHIYLFFKKSSIMTTFFVFFINNFMSKNNKKKGNRVELELCKILNKHFNLPFIRTPNSGAYVGGKNSIRKSKLSQNQIINSTSDIIMPDELKHLVIECKGVKDFPFHLIFTTMPAILKEWLNQLLLNVGDNQIGIICFKVNNKGWFVCVPKAYCVGFGVGTCYESDFYIIAELNLFLEWCKTDLLYWS